MDEWLDIYCQGKRPDFASMYKDADAVTDIPPAMWFQEIYEAFPDAKVILSVRDNEEVWAPSMGKQLELLQTLGGRLQRVALLWLAPIAAPTYLLFHLKEKLFLDTNLTAFLGSLNWKSTVLFKKKYREHNHRVQAVIPKEKLLIYNVKQGWQPLCEFLGCDMPQQEFPRENVACSISYITLSKKIQDFKRNAFVLLAFLVLLASVFYLYL